MPTAFTVKVMEVDEPLPQSLAGTVYVIVVLPAATAWIKAPPGTAAKTEAIDVFELLHVPDGSPVVVKKVKEPGHTDEAPTIDPALPPPGTTVMV